MYGTKPGNERPAPSNGEKKDTYLRTHCHRLIASPMPLLPYARGVVELRETVFDMRMACHTQQEIAEAVGYSEKAIPEFVDLLRNGVNGIDTENPVSSENPQLTISPGDREFEEPEEEDANRLRVLNLNKRVLFRRRVFYVLRK